jgi:hypothetical protein
MQIFYQSANNAEGELKDRVTLIKSRGFSGKNPPSSNDFGLGTDNME